MVQLPATLSVKTNPTGYMAAVSAVYAASVMLYNAHYHHGVISTPVIITAVILAASLLTRQIVTPVAAPKDGAGTLLVPASWLPAAPVPPDAGVRVVPPQVISTGAVFPSGLMPGEEAGKPSEEHQP